MNSINNIVLITPPSQVVNDDRLEPPLGLLYIASNIQEEYKEKVSIYDMTGCKTNTQINSQIENIPLAEIYGINCFCTNYVYAKKAIERIKKQNPKSYIIIGGPQPSGAPDFTIQDSNADLVIIGEGEDAFNQSIDSYVNNNPLTGIFSLPGRPNLDNYNFPARELVKTNSYSRKFEDSSVISLLTSRGCKHKCTHCNSVVMGGGSNNVRYRSTSNIIKELKSLRDKYSHFKFNDDHFTGNPNLSELLNEIKNLDITYRAFARVEDLNEKTSKELYESGCKFVSIGLESLNQNNLRALGKHKQSGHEKNIEIAKNNNLTIRASFMIGLPYDTKKTVEEAFQKASQLQIDEYSIYALIPYPGTIIAKHPEKFGYKITKTNFTDYFQMGIDRATCFALEHKNFTPNDVKKWKILAENILENAGIKHMSKSEVAK